MLKLLAVAVAAERVFAALPLVAKFPLVFLAVLLGDSLRFRRSGESPLFLEDILSGVFLYAGTGFMLWGLDYVISLYTGRHAGPVVPALVLAVIDRAWPSGRSSSKRR